MCIQYEYKFVNYIVSNQHIGENVWERNQVMPCGGTCLPVRFAFICKLLFRNNNKNNCGFGALYFFSKIL